MKNQKTYIKNGIITDGSIILSSGIEINNFSTDITLSGNSDSTVPTEKAILTNIDSKFDPLSAIHTLTKNPLGFLNKTSSSISFNDSNRTFTISPTGDLFQYYNKGNLIDKTVTENVQISNDNGLHFIYYDTNNILSESNIWNNSLILDNTLASFLYWNSEVSAQIMFCDERHGCMMDGTTHAYLHLTQGTLLESGGGLANIVTDDDGDLSASITFANTDTIIWDEDNRFSHSSRGVSDNIPIYYQTGAVSASIWNVKEDSPFPCITGGTGRAVYNEINGTTYQLTEITNSNFGIYHVAVTNDETRPYVVFLSQNEYSSTTNARNAIENEINTLITNGLPIVEFKFVGSCIFQTKSTYNNAVMSRHRTLDDGSDYLDLRGKILGRSGSESTVYVHNALANIQGGIINEYYHITNTEHDYLQSNLEHKTFAYLPSSTNTSLTAIDTWEPLSGDFNNTINVGFSLSADAISGNYITCNNTIPIYYEIDWHMTFSFDVNSTYVYHGIAKNFNIDNISASGSIMGQEAKTADTKYQFSGTNIVLLSAGDTIQLQVKSDKTGNLTTYHYTTSIKPF